MKYEEFIDSCRNQLLTEGYEVHHIIPRCVGGADAQSNLIKLTYE